MIQHKYRNINSVSNSTIIKKMVPTTDTVCPHCRHVFQISPSDNNTTMSSAKPETDNITINNIISPLCNQLHCQSKVNVDTPPTPPPRLKSTPNPYTNVPSQSHQPVTSSTQTSGTNPNGISTSTSSKSYVTMSNLNLATNIPFVSNQIAPMPTFVPLSPTTCSASPMILAAQNNDSVNIPLESKHQNVNSLDIPTILSSTEYEFSSTNNRLNTQFISNQMHKPADTWRNPSIPMNLKTDSDQFNASDNFCGPNKNSSMQFNISNTSVTASPSNLMSNDCLTGSSTNSSNIACLGNVVKTRNKNSLISNNEINFSNNRVYRQLSGGGLVENVSDDEIRIHEPQPMHQMCGGGLINTRTETNSPFSPVENNTTAASIQISPSTSNISILVPNSMNTSLEISSNQINITVPRLSPTFVLRTPSSRRTNNASQRRSNSLATPNNPVFVPTDVLITKQLSPIDDMQCLTRTVHCLKESGWFHEGLSWNESEALLTGSANGTFIVRESSNPNFLFAITVQTEQEPTSVRIQYDNGRFRLDCVSHVTPIVPQFDCVVNLIEYYVMKHDANKQKTNSNQCQVNNFLSNQVFVDENGHINSVVSLKKPLRSTVPSLMHCSRLAINKQLRNTNIHYSKSSLSQILDNLELPKSLKMYLFEYPYSL